MVLRFFYLNAHYRSPLDFDPARTLEEAREAYARLALPAGRIADLLDGFGPDHPGAELSPDLSDASESLEETLDATLANDFNSREAIALLFGWTRRLTEELPRLGTYSSGALEELAGPYRWGEEVLGLFVRPPGSRKGAWEALVPLLIEARARARARGDFAEADRIRDELKANGVRLEDGASGTRWEPSGAS